MSDGPQGATTKLGSGVGILLKYSPQGKNGTSRTFGDEGSPHIYVYYVYFYFHMMSQNDL